MNFFNIDLKKLILTALILALPLLSINMQQRPQESNWLSKPFTLLGSGISEIFYGFSTGVKDTTALYLNLINVKKQSETVKSENNELRARLSKLDEILIENDRLRTLLEFKQNTGMSLIGAQIIGRDLVVDHSTVTIDKGLADGLKDGMAVITSYGVLGYIYRPEQFTSAVMLINDRYSVVDGIVQRTRAHGIVEGKSQSNAALQLKYVERSDDVQVGDIIVTGGLDNIFPKGFPIATVESVEKKAISVSIKVDLKPIVDPYKIEEVFVISNAANADFTEKFAPPAETATTTEGSAAKTTGTSNPATPNAAPATTGTPASVTTSGTTAAKPSTTPAAAKPTAPKAETPNKPEAPQTEAPKKQEN